MGFHGIVNRITTMSYGQLAVLYGSTILLFGIVYFVLATWLPGHGPSIPGGAHPFLRFLESLYFSTMTATTVGYGDITPHGFSKILVGFQAISSLFIFTGNLTAFAVTYSLATNRSTTELLTHKFGARNYN